MNAAKVFKRGDYHTVLATENISKGETILKLQGAVSSLKDKYSLQIEEKKHLFALTENPEEEASIFRFLNHSCSPNSYFNIPNGTLIALRNISTDEEITFHYCTTEFDMTSPFQCLCGSNNCLHEIKGYKYLSSEVKKQLELQAAPHLKILESITT